MPIKQYLHITRITALSPLITSTQSSHLLTSWAHRQSTSRTRHTDRERDIMIGGASRARARDRRKCTAICIRSKKARASTALRVRKVSRGRSICRRACSCTCKYYHGFTRTFISRSRCSSPRSLGRVTSVMLASLIVGTQGLRAQLFFSLDPRMIRDLGVLIAACVLWMWEQWTGGLALGDCSCTAGLLWFGAGKCSRWFEGLDWGSSFGIHVVSVTEAAKAIVPQPVEKIHTWILDLEFRVDSQMDIMFDSR